MDRNVKRDVVRREAAAMRVRVSTWAGVALGLLLTVLFTMAAAGSTHTRRVITHVVRARRPVTSPVTAPAPPLVSVEAPAATQAPPSPAPSTAAPAVTPVVVSGGS